jgi:hypothetical protein
MQYPFSHQNGHPPRHGPLAYDPYIGFISIGVDNVLTFAGAAATRYIAGNIPGGEDLHVQAEATYTRLMKTLRDLIRKLVPAQTIRVKIWS